jgi:hypothetical protein
MPSMVSISIIRNRPIITALICAGRIGSIIGAELGSMRVTEQIDAMKFLALIRSILSGHASHGYHFNASILVFFLEMLFLFRIVSG